MSGRVLRRIVLVALCACATALTGRAQHSDASGAGHGAPRQTLFTARARAEEVADRGRPRDAATGTGAFILSADARNLAYQFTWEGLATTQGLTIDLHNFGAGAVGKSITLLCGSNRPCPSTARGGTISGTWAIDPALVHELAAERIYLDVHTAANREGALRAQIVALPWMVHSRQFVLRLVASGERGANGTGTFYVTPFPQGTQLTFDLTVADLPVDDLTIEVRRGRITTRLPMDGVAVRRRGGTISGVVKSQRGAAPLPPALFQAIESGGEILVKAKGKLVGSGQLVPVL